VAGLIQKVEQEEEEGVLRTQIVGRKGREKAGEGLERFVGAFLA